MVSLLPGVGPCLGFCCLDHRLLISLRDWPLDQSMRVGREAAVERGLDRVASLLAFSRYACRSHLAQRPITSRVTIREILILYSILNISEISKTRYYEPIGDSL
jgi:hypothetical protein